MDRRKFIKTVGAAAGATLLSGVGIAKPPNC
ncbi:twin-arginine translocation signal domain-containing protein [Bacteroides uniformis]|nr:twin-arginine translocation signal domain-containing protein [Bacteroides uniformis]MCE8481860.1 twin-arginine translocation signal domain-containing protein [Bacteroides uniformis]